MEVLLAALDGRRLLLVAVEVGMDELDEAVDVFRRHLRGNVLVRGRVSEFQGEG